MDAADHGQLWGLDAPAFEKSKILREAISAELLDFGIADRYVSAWDIDDTVGGHFFRRKAAGRACPVLLSLNCAPGYCVDTADASEVKDEVKDGLDLWTQDCKPSSPTHAYSSIAGATLTATVATMLAFGPPRSLIR